MDTEQVEVNRVSPEPPTEDRVIQWLLEAWRFNKGKVEFEVRAEDWIRTWPDVSELIQRAMRVGAINAYPSGVAGDWTIRLTPDTLKLLKSEPQKVHRQMTVDGKRVDLRNERAHIILTPPIENLLPLAEIWLRELETETDPRAKRAILLKVERLQAYRGHELPDQLKQRILQTLANTCTEGMRHG